MGEALKGAFYVNFRENRIFGWWFANRILFWGSFIAINSFLINYLMDVIKMDAVRRPEFLRQPEDDPGRGTDRGGAALRLAVR